MGNPAIHVIYIAGYGRSGSTLLERLLAAGTGIFGAGELHYVPRKMQDRSSRCGCGNPLSSCRFWNRVFARVQHLNGDSNGLLSLLRSHESIKGATKRILESGSLFHAKYRRFNTELFEAIRKHTEDSVRYIVDSSKTARKAFFRPMGLHACDRIRLKLIHLTRDPRACLWSNMRDDRDGVEHLTRRNEPVQTLFRHPVLRTGLHWPISNTSPHLCQMRCQSHQYIRIKYEDYTSEPIKTLSRLEEFLDHSLTDVKELVRRDQPLPNAHQVAGNRLRYKNPLRLHADPESWKQHITSGQSALFDLCGGLFRHLYGYH